ncbi:ATP-binding protein [Actinokineospora sp. NBRC 105648]|uniref:ATP-binding protein n=1 Tax=Actinokineospora sp. NBRC 105648 TaxID=3032206 RepID=UPI0024A59797|nr:ATP-binding protein [Actinokineospora sp. NBRC 105648]GLZ42726.1 ATPase [Actinokineospora sp. NBRC 105648]
MTALAEDVGVLWERLGAVEALVRAAVARRLAADPGLADPHRGLYLSDEMVVDLLQAGPAEPGGAEVPPVVGGPLGRLAESFGLSAVDVAFLLIALAPELDARFERFYGYLNDDVTRRCPTVGLALDLHGLSTVGPARFRFAASAPLVAGGLLEVRDPERPFLSREVRVPDRVVAHLLGADPALDESDVDGVVAERGAAVYLRGDDQVAGPRVVGELTGSPNPLELVPDLVREARLRGATLVVGPVDDLPAPVLRALLAQEEHVPLVLHGTRPWDPACAPTTPLTITAAPSDGQRWTRALAGTGVAAADLSAYQLSTGRTRAAVSVARRMAAREGRAVTAADVRAGVRSQDGAGLERLARRVFPTVGWADLVVPEHTRHQLVQLADRARHRETVLGRWRMRPGGGRGRGVLALFAGESGTGKTMAAEVVAGELGMDLYVVDLSTVVDKYVGETEKNLERIFTEAAGVNGVLLFDEADAIFGKRAAVRDAHDRYANMESAYLLQRMESFDGIAVLTTNLRANLDEAFTRRLDVIAAFPVPDAAHRLLLWDTCLGTELPRSEDLDLAWCADRFELSGGAIRACAVSAAYLAAAGGRAVCMADLVAAVRAEYLKLGRLIRESEFAQR